MTAEERIDDVVRRNNYGSCLGESRKELIAAVKAAVLAEREACAVEAEENRFGGHVGDPLSEIDVERFARLKGDAIAAAIRARD
jgi:hypothetical protein